MICVTVGPEVERNDSGTVDRPGIGVEPERNRLGTALMLSDGDDTDVELVTADCEKEMLIEIPCRL